MKIQIIEGLALASARVLGFAFLLGAPFFFGVKGQTTEMGLAIAAGALALAFSFMDRLESFGGAGFKATLRNVVDVATAPDVPAAKPDAVVRAGTFDAQGPIDPQPGVLPLQERSGAFGLDTATRQVLKSLEGDKYQWRSVSGIVADTQLLPYQVETALSWLAANRLATATQGARGRVWGLLPDGRTLLNTIRATENATTSR